MNDDPSTDDPDRELLKLARKERKKQKKQVKREEQQIEKERRLLSDRLKPKNNRIHFISQELADKIQNSAGSSNSSAVVDVSQPSRSSKFAPTKLNLGSVIATKSRPLVTNIKEKDTPTKQYEGNILDSSQPVRKRGKHREIEKRKKLSKLKTTLNDEFIGEMDAPYEYPGIHNPMFELYCDNCVTEELNGLVKSFLSDIVKFQEKLYKKDPIKGVAKRRYIIGLHETKKYLKLSKTSLLIIAPNIKIVKEDGILHKTVEELKDLAIQNSIPYVFALSRNVLRKITLKNCPVSCVAVVDYSGAEEKYKMILELTQNLRDCYRKQMNVEDNIEDEVVIQELKEKVINILL